eukprot:CAMPEP_0115016788 /NCGR_PEP_ID=MMETSP0216-20121206/27684_1 /TAXON_ID=223996 /ORGANISM="Protocruzia adherens, Strain Boccale" /LENGTH=75 /DNA_ID=CAMNT_0002387389 /DNA_START=99 /DNA_END=323 /DNA_ORIENTATION=-
MTNPFIGSAFHFCSAISHFISGSGIAACEILAKAKMNPRPKKGKKSREYWKKLKRKRNFWKARIIPVPIRVLKFE